MNHLPAWVEASSSDDDSSVGSSGFANTTFGLKYLLQGILNHFVFAAHLNLVGARGVATKRTGAVSIECYIKLVLSAVKL